MTKNPNWQETDQLAIYKRSRGVELGATEKQLQQAVRAGLEPRTSGFQVRRPDPLEHAASLTTTQTKLSLITLSPMKISASCEHHLFIYMYTSNTFSLPFSQLLKYHQNLKEV